MIHRKGLIKVANNIKKEIFEKHKLESINNPRRITEG